MKVRSVPDHDSVFRHSVHPVSFRGGKVFDPRNLFHLSHRLDGSIQTSLAWQRYLPTIDHVHDYGCRMAHRRNENNIAAGTYKEKNRQIYCGAYEMRARSIRQLFGSELLDEIAKADITHEPEEGEIAHLNVIITLRAGTSVDPENTKTAIVDRMWRASQGPATHICGRDQDVSNHPGSTLVAAPGGAYVDSRSWLSRLLCLVRFRCEAWIQRGLR